jgi:hypothetical protein
MIKVDLHTHSTASYDGGVSADQYRRVIESGKLDYIAVTDHNRIDFAEGLQAKLGEYIIVGEEIMTSEGEIIGLFLDTVIESGLTPLETMQQIKNQGGVVYIPHPFETVRKGLHPETLEDLAEYIDVVEICNGRAFFQNRSEQAVVWARMNRKLGAASSDAHGFQGLGKTYTSLSDVPTRENLLELLVKGIPMTDHPGLRALLYPKYHRLRKKIRGER